MESVWWVFKTLHEKDLVYRGFKVMPYSTACNTPLSNFEANLNYKEDTRDPAVVVTFPLVSDPGMGRYWRARVPACLRTTCVFDRPCLADVVAS